MNDNIGGWTPTYSTDDYYDPVQYDTAKHQRLIIGEAITVDLPPGYGLLHRDMIVDVFDPNGIIVFRRQASNLRLENV